MKTSSDEKIIKLLLKRCLPMMLLLTCYITPNTVQTRRIYRNNKVFVLPFKLMVGESAFVNPK